MSNSVKPPNNQDSVTAQNESASVKPPNKLEQAALTPAAQLIPVKPPNNA
jgi:hypothetical protein